MRIVFVVQPLHGHLRPALPLARELACRGHRVGVATGEGLEHLVREAGVECIPLPWEIPPLPSRWDDRVLKRSLEIADRLVDDARVHFPMMRDLVAADPADVICYDWMTITGKMLADVTARPAVALVPTLAANEKHTLYDAMSVDEMPDGVAEFEQRRRAFALEHGATADVDLTRGDHVEQLTIVFTAREFQTAHETFDDRFRFVGPQLTGRDPGDWTPPRPGHPLVYVSMGTLFAAVPSFYRSCVQAFASSRWDVAMTAGSDVAGTSEPAPNIDVRPGFPQLAVLRRADVFVSHAGMGSLMEAASLGVPVVAVPQMAEQAANARRAAELGFARCLDPDDLTPESLRAVVEQVAADDAMRARAAEMARVVAASGGVPAAADAVEAYGFRSCAAATAGGGALRG